MRTNGYEHRLAAWLVQVDAYAARHGITRQQAVSVIDDLDGYGALCKWVEINEFLEDAKKE